MFRDQTTTTTDSLSEETIYDILSNRRRRYIVHILKRSETPVDVTEASKQITAWEMGIDIDEVSYEDRHPVYTALRDSHIPALAKHDLISYDESTNTVTAQPALTQLDVYVETLRGNEISWSLYYLGIASISVLLLAAVVVDVPAIATIGPLGVSLFTAATFGVSGIVHYYYNTRSQLGNLETPPEVRKRQ